MDLTNNNALINHRIACEAFLRRTTLIEHPYILKGSFVTKQYFEDTVERIPNDLDWVYTLPLEYFFEADNTFKNWINEIISINIADGVIFKNINRASVSWNDYGIGKDFPTVSIDIDCSVDGKTLLGGIRIDISFDFEVATSPVPIDYIPLRGDKFRIINTVQLSTQIAWKLHQTILSPRFKDIFDLIHLLPITNTGNESKKQSIQNLAHECQANGGDINTLYFYVTEIAERYAYLFENNQIHTEEFKRLKNEFKGIEIVLTIYITDYKLISTNINATPQSLSAILRTFRHVLNDAGFTIDALQNFPQNSVTKSTLWDKIKDIFK